MIVRQLAPLCLSSGIERLDIFGSVARGEARVGSDVDLIAKFREIPGLDFFEIAQKMETLLGVPVHLLIDEDVNVMTNPFRKASIERDRRTIYAA